MTTEGYERHVRYLLLLGEGGQLVMHKLLDREASYSKTKHGKTLEELLIDNKTDLKRSGLNKVQLKKLFPSRGETSVKTWDISLSVCVLLELFKPNLTKDERRQLKVLRGLWNEVQADNQSVSVAPDIHDDARRDLEDALYRLTVGLDSDTRDQCQRLIEDVNKTGPIQHAGERMMEISKYDEDISDVLEALTGKGSKAMGTVHGQRCESADTGRRRKSVESDHKLAAVSACHRRESVGLSQKRASIDLRNRRGTIDQAYRRESMNQVLRRLSLDSGMRRRSMTTGSCHQHMSQIREEAYKDVQPQQRVYVNIVDDRSKCDIVGSCQMSNGDVLLIDTNNCKLKLLNQNHKIRGRVEFQAYPLDVCCIDTSLAVVALHDSTIQCVTITAGERERIYAKIELGTKTVLHHKCNGLAYNPAKEEILVTDDKSVYVYAAQYVIKGVPDIGRHKRVLYTDKAMLVSFRHIAVANNGKKVYVTDRKGSIMAISNSGKVIAIFRDDELKDAHGLCVDSKSRIYVCGSESVVQIDAACMYKINTITRGMAQPRTVCFDSKNYTLLVGQDNDALLVHEIMN